MTKTFTIKNRKYFRPFDNTDNPCCWQIDEVGNDIDDILSHASVNAEVMYEDWGTAWLWYTKHVEHSMQLECIDVDNAEYRIDYFALRRKWCFFKADVSDDESDFIRIVPGLQRLNSAAV